MLRATGRVLCFTDADLPYDLDGVRLAYDAINGRQCQVVFGARDLQESAVQAPRRFLRTLATWAFRSIVAQLISRQVNSQRRVAHFSKTNAASCTAAVTSRWSAASAITAGPGWGRVAMPISKEIGTPPVAARWLSAGATSRIFGHVLRPLSSSLRDHEIAHPGSPGLQVTHQTRSKSRSTDPASLAADAVILCPYDHDEMVYLDRSLSKGTGRPKDYGYFPGRPGGDYRSAGHHF